MKQRHRARPNRAFLVLLAFALAATSVPAAAQQTPAPEVVPAPNGAVILPSPTSRQVYDRYHYAPARRLGNVLYISGVVAGRRPGEANDLVAYKAQVRRAFAQLEHILAASGSSFADVAMINTFHVWEGPNVTGTREQLFEAFSAVKDEFMPPPYAAWTAVGTSGLIADNGVVEIQMIANIPSK